MDVRYARRLTEELTEAFEAVRKIEENSLNAAHGSSISTSESNLIEARRRTRHNHQPDCRRVVHYARFGDGGGQQARAQGLPHQGKGRRGRADGLCQAHARRAQDQRGAPLLSYQSCALHQSGIHRRRAGGPHPRAGEAEQLLPQKQLFLPKKAAHPAEITGAGGTETRYELYHNRDRARRP